MERIASILAVQTSMASGRIGDAEEGGGGGSADAAAAAATAEGPGDRMGDAPMEYVPRRIGSALSVGDGVGDVAVDMRRYTLEG